jgi:hypothetical protein
VRGEVFGVRGWRAFCGGEDPGGRAGGGRAEARARGAATMKTEVGRAGLGAVRGGGGGARIKRVWGGGGWGAVCGGDEYRGQAVGVGGRFAGFPCSGRVVFGGGGGLQTALNC